jgi:hypothetical protein
MMMMVAAASKNLPHLAGCGCNEGDSSLRAEQQGKEY